MFFLGFCVLGANSKNKPASIQILRKTSKNRAQGLPERSQNTSKTSQERPKTRKNRSTVIQNAAKVAECLQEGPKYEK